MNREICPKVKIIMNHSVKEAKSFEDNKVRPEHIILSILVDNDNECIKVLKLLNIDTVDLYDRVSDFLRQTDLTPRVTNTTRKTLPFSDETKAIIKTLDEECEKLNDNTIDTTHVMLGILFANLPVNNLLGKFGVTYNRFKKSITDMNKTQPKNSALGGEENEDQEFYKRNKKETDTKSKTVVLDNFCRDVSKSVEKGEIDPVVGREKEIKRISQILSRRKKNNPVLIGEPGVGKCICSDTEVVMRNDLTGEVFKTTISNLLNTFTNIPLEKQ